MLLHQINLCHGLSSCGISTNFIDSHLFSGTVDKTAFYWIDLHSLSKLLKCIEGRMYGIFSTHLNLIEFPSFLLNSNECNVLFWIAVIGSKWFCKSLFFSVCFDDLASKSGITADCKQRTQKATAGVYACIQEDYNYKIW